MQTVASGWLIYDLTRSAAAVGVLTFLSRGPGMVLSAYGGQLADRYDRRRLAILLYIGQAVPAAARFQRRALRRAAHSCGAAAYPRHHIGAAGGRAAWPHQRPRPLLKGQTGPSTAPIQAVLFGIRGH